MSLNGKRILVTGGAGFIGSHLCAKLLQRGAEVLCVDNFYTGRRGNVVALLDDKRFEILRHDVTFQGVGGPLMTAQGLDSLFPMSDLSVMGLAEIVPKYPHLRRRLTLPPARRARHFSGGSPVVCWALPSAAANRLRWLYLRLRLRLLRLHLRLHLQLLTLRLERLLLLLLLLLLLVELELLAQLLLLALA